jgi:hypothetical protein
LTTYTQLQIARPLRSTPITGTSALLRAGPPTLLATVLNFSRFIRLKRSLSPPTGQQCRVVSSHVPRKSSRLDSRHLHAGHRLASKRVFRQTSPREQMISPVLMSLVSITTLRQWFTLVRLSNPYLTPLGRLFHIAHHGRVTTPAACGGLKPPPVGRLRRAFLHLSRSIAFQNSAYILNSFRRSWHT